MQKWQVLAYSKCTKRGDWYLIAGSSFWLYKSTKNECDCPWNKGCDPPITKPKQNA